MIIRKQFKFEGAHIVRDCSSDRCKKSIHGHSYIVEVKLESTYLDNGQMVYDFGLMKGTIKNIIDSFDHAYAMWDREKPEFKEWIKSHSDRWIEMPVSPTAEMFSLMFFAFIQEIINATLFANGEDKYLKLHSVRVHETTTGWAESFESDYFNLWQNWGFCTKDVIFSQTIKDEWSDPLMLDKLFGEDRYPFINPRIKLEYDNKTTD